jgi:hypothetical protein
MQNQTVFSSLQRLPLLIAAFAGLAVCSLSAAAQSSVYTPKASSPERKAIINALRVSVEKDLKMPVIFVVKHPEIFFRVQQGWAFVGAEFRHPNGDAMGAGYFKADPDGSDTSNMVIALLHRVHGRWQVVDHDTGAIDAAWADYSQKYHTPVALFPKSN